MTTAQLKPISVRAAVDVAALHLQRRPLLVVSDFDGTLSNIVNDPWGASILPLGRRALRALAALDGVHVAVLSGRSSADVAARVRVGGISYVGNHGMERGFVPRRGRAERLRADVDEASHEAIHVAERVGDELPGLISEPWLIVERKPPSVAFHWRQAPDVDAAAARVMAAVEALDPEHVLERFPGRRVLELRPPGAVAKGEAFERMVEQWKPRSVFLLGDDIGDAMAFTALRRLRAAGVTDGVAVAVQARAEVPVQVLDSADVVLSSPADATRFLAALYRRLAASPPRRLIELREVIETDLEVFFEHQADPEAAAMAKFGSRVLDAHLAHWRRILADPTTINRTVLLDGQVAGSFGSWLAEDRRMVGYWIGRRFWGLGVATEALRQFAAQLSERPLYAWVATSNVASARVLAKAGFVLDSPEPVVGEDGVEESLYRLP